MHSQQPSDQRQQAEATAEPLRAAASDRNGQHIPLDLKSIRAAIDRVEADARAVLAAESQSRADIHARTNAAVHQTTATSVLPAADHGIPATGKASGHGEPANAALRTETGHDAMPQMPAVFQGDSDMVAADSQDVVRSVAVPHPPLVLAQTNSAARAGPSQTLMAGTGSQLKSLAVIEKEQQAAAAARGESEQRAITALEHRLQAELALQDAALRREQVEQLADTAARARCEAEDRIRLACEMRLQAERKLQSAALARVEAEQNADVQVHARLAVEAQAAQEAQSRAAVETQAADAARIRIEEEQRAATLAVLRHTREQTAVELAQARNAAEQDALEMLSQQAEVQRSATETAVVKAQHTAQLTQVEREHVAAEAQAVDMLQQRIATEIEGRHAAVARDAAEQRHIALLRSQAESDLAAQAATQREQAVIEAALVMTHRETQLTQQRAQNAADSALVLAALVEIEQGHADAEAEARSVDEKRLQTERDNVETLAQTLQVAQQKLITEQAIQRDAAGILEAQQSHLQSVRAQEEMTQALRLAQEVEAKAIQHVVAQVAEQAQLQRRTAQTALLTARESVQLTQMERDRSVAEQEALAAVLARLRNEQNICGAAQARAKADIQSVHDQQAQEAQEVEQASRQAAVQTAHRQAKIQAALDVAEKQRQGADHDAVMAARAKLVALQAARDAATQRTRLAQQHQAVSEQRLQLEVLTLHADKIRFDAESDALVQEQRHALLQQAAAKAASQSASYASALAHTAQQNAQAQDLVLKAVQQKHAVALRRQQTTLKVMQTLQQKLAHEDAALVLKQEQLAALDACNQAFSMEVRKEAEARRQRLAMAQKKCAAATVLASAQEDRLAQVRASTAHETAPVVSRVEVHAALLVEQLIERLTGPEAESENWRIRAAALLAEVGSPAAENDQAATGVAPAGKTPVPARRRNVPTGAVAVAALVVSCACIAAMGFQRMPSASLNAAVPVNAMPLASKSDPATASVRVMLALNARPL